MCGICASDPGLPHLIQYFPVPSISTQFHFSFWLNKIALRMHAACLLSIHLNRRSLAISYVVDTNLYTGIQATNKTDKKSL